MKHVVVMGDLRGEDIRPAELFSRLRELSIEDARRFFGDPAARVEVNCPACGCAERLPSFRKQEFLYNQCRACKSVYVSPRPSEAALEEYYDRSRASRFRAEHYSEKTQEARRRHILRSTANWLGRLCDEAGDPALKSYADIGTNFPAMFDEIRGLDLFEEFYSIDPIPDFNEAIEERGARVVDAPPAGLGAVSAFEQLEHEFSPDAVLRQVREMLAPGGMLFFTTKTISGFDLQMLWDKAPYIYVPEHLNLLSIDGLTELIRRTGFRLIELSTPGRLDVELVQRAAQNDPTVKLPPFIAYLLNHRDEETHEDFQEFLQRRRLSSHVRVAAIKEQEEKTA